MIYHRNADWLEADVRDEMLMMHADTGRFVSLNQTGTFLWKRLEEPRDAAALSSALAQEFEVDDSSAQADVAAWLDEMSRLELVERDVDAVS